MFAIKNWCLIKVMIWVSNKIHHVYNTKGKGRGSLFSIIDGCTDLKDHKNRAQRNVQKLQVNGSTWFWQQILKSAYKEKEIKKKNVLKFICNAFPGNKSDNKALRYFQLCHIGLTGHWPLMGSNFPLRCKKWCNSSNIGEAIFGYITKCSQKR